MPDNMARTRQYFYVADGRGQSFPLRLLPRLSCDQARSVFRIGGVPLSLFLAADCSALMWRNISEPPESSLMKPKPRSAFHIFKVPVAIALYFPFAFRPPHLDFGERGARAQFCRTACNDTE